MDRIKEELSGDHVTLIRSSEITDGVSRTLPEAHGEWQICHSFAIPVNDIPQHSTMLQLKITSLSDTILRWTTLEGSQQCSPLRIKSPLLCQLS